MTKWEPRADADLDVTLEQLARMHRALADLHRERGRYGDAWFAMMAEGPLEEIARLEIEVARMTGRADLEASSATEQADLWMRIEGRDLHWPDAPTSVLSGFLDTLRKGVQVVAEWCCQHGISARPRASLRDSCDFEVAALAPGSVRIGVRLPEKAQTRLPLEDVDRDAARYALRLYLAAATWAAEDGAAPLEADPLQRLVLTQVKRLLPRPRGRVDLVELSGRATRGNRPIRLDRAAHRRIDAVLEHRASQVVKYEGDLREIDLDLRTFTLRNIPTDASTQVSCAFEADLDQTAYDALNQRVIVVGERITDPRRAATPIRVLTLEVIGSLED